MKSHRRISRALISFLAVILVIGLVTWAYNIGRRSGATETAGADKSDNRAVAVDPGLSTPGPARAAAPTNTAESKLASAVAGAAASGALVTQTPTGATSASSASDGAAPASSATQPAAAPVLAATINVPTTRPAAAGAQALASSAASGAPAPGANTHSAGAHPAGAHALSTTGPSEFSVRLASVTLSATPLADAKAQQDAGNVLTARRTPNAALHSGRLTDADVAAAKQMLNKINETIMFSPRRFPDDPMGGTMKVPPGGALARIASSHDVTPELLMRINGITNPRRLQADQTIKVINGPFHAVVYKGRFTIELWLGSPNEPSSMYVTSFPVGLGQDDSTPTGTWAVSTALKNPAYYSPRGEGVIAADDPKNPLGEYWIALTGTDGQAVGKTSYGIHGTIDPTSIGKQSSLGCIRLRNEDIARVYEMLVPGKSTVLVRD
jgi:lipoprotein-anchoring transpeptidase ErfK/SrfK